MAITTPEHIADLRRNIKALNRFRASARKMKPTRRHKAALFENMLGTVYAINKERTKVYFDYDYEQALLHIGAHSDVRVHRVTRGYNELVGDGRSVEVPAGKLVWFVIYE